VRLCALLLAAAVSGCCTDTVLLKNGDRLSGEVQGVEGGVLLLRTAYAGVIRISAAGQDGLFGATRNTTSISRREWWRRMRSGPSRRART
jgi:hypothetical protein